ncbi:uncharacterized protein LOC121368422 [Gigantopelta aegis]|uniref:uncharacterized protein LOC121368422 n=1 Tax=Gigantopelta aegis TaxID=1735272 RepID=UPI001B88E277|nr:uncharacterized protein LOC121368422 [Gigantopelta aegis]XP_041349087.1 uncharacterized protein LOC121368422 [Gigantopelta aegis]
MRTIFAGWLFLIFFAHPCLCDLLESIDDCHRIAWNQTCPDQYCTYYFRDPGPYLTCCLCGPARLQIGVYYGVLLVAAAILLVYELCCASPSPLSLVVAVVNGSVVVTIGDEQDPDDEREKRVILEV